jgi:hypothetical protein
MRGGRIHPEDLLAKERMTVERYFAVGIHAQPSHSSAHVMAARFFFLRWCSWAAFTGLLRP